MKKQIVFACLIALVAGVIVLLLYGDTSKKHEANGLEIWNNNPYKSPQGNNL